MTENSTIDVGTAVSATFGDVTVNAGRTLTSTGGTPDGGLKIAGSINGAGTLRASPNTSIEFTKNGAASSGAPTLATAGAARLRFNPGSGNTFGGSAVAAVTNDGVLHAVSGVTDLSNAVVTGNPGGVVISAGLSSITGDFYDVATVPIAQDSVNTFGWSGLDSKGQFDAALAGKTPLANRSINLPINFPRGDGNLVDGGENDRADEVFNVQGANLGVPLTGNDDFVVRFAGKLNVFSPGPTGFGIAANDAGVLFLDLAVGPGTNWVKVMADIPIGAPPGSPSCCRTSKREICLTATISKCPRVTTREATEQKVKELAAAARRIPGKVIVREREME